MEQGPLAGYVRDAIKNIVDNVIAADPTKNGLIARAENSNDERDAARLGLLQAARLAHRV